MNNTNATILSCIEGIVKDGNLLFLKTKKSTNNIIPMV